MSTSPPNGGASPPPPRATDGTPAAEEPAGRGPEAPRKHRNPWIWASALLALIAVGMLVWALSTRSDLDDTQKEVDDLQAQVEQGQQTGNSFVAAAKTVFQDLTRQLGATSEDLDAAQQDVEDAQQTADQAQQEADAARQAAEEADNATDKAEAEADQAKAEAKAAESKATIAADCAKAYVSAIGSLFEGDDVRAQAATVGDQLEAVTRDCKGALDST